MNQYEKNKACAERLGYTVLKQGMQNDVFVSVDGCMTRIFNPTEYWCDTGILIDWLLDDEYQLDLSSRYTSINNHERQRIKTFFHEEGETKEAIVDCFLAVTDKE